MWTNSSGLIKETPLAAPTTCSPDSIDNNDDQLSAGRFKPDNNGRTRRDGLIGAEVQLGPSNENRSTLADCTTWSELSLNNFSTQQANQDASPVTTSQTIATTTTTPIPSPDLHLRELELKQREVYRLARMLSHWRTNRDVLDRWPWAARPGIAVPVGARCATSTVGACDLECGGGGLASLGSGAESARGVAEYPPEPTDRVNNYAQTSSVAPIDLVAQMTPNMSIGLDHTTALNHIIPTPSTQHHRNHSNHHHHHNHRHRNLHDSSSEIVGALADVDLDLAAPRRPWQSLVLPVVLACIIFLVALWTRQISLAVTNDTILMIMILMGIFIVMSGLALWLSCDQYLENSQTDNETDGRQQQDDQQHDGHQVRPRCQCQHSSHHSQHHHHHRHHNHLNVSQNMASSNSQHGHHVASGTISSNTIRNERRCRKCCVVSVIDCQPPDYYSAVINSMPVHHFLALDGDNDQLEHQNEQFKSSMKTRLIGGEKNNQNKNDDEEEDDGDTDSQLYLSPPSYEELQKDATK